MVQSDKLKKIIAEVKEESSPVITLSNELIADFSKELDSAISELDMIMESIGENSIEDIPDSQIEYYCVKIPALMYYAGQRVDTELAEVYSVEIPVITAWVRDDNYVHSTKEIFLGEPSLEGFLHQFRHHLQNKAREPQYKYLLVENDPKADYRIPYKDCMYRMYGEDDARAWARMVIELAS